MPFDRLVKTVDQWAAARARADVFAQIGPTEYRPTAMRAEPFLAPADFKRRFETASAIVSHAGTGSIITALQLGKPILVMPRRASLRETRNDHQVATAEQFRRFESVLVARDERELAAKLDLVDGLVGRRAVGASASSELIAALRAFIDGAPA